MRRVRAKTRMSSEITIGLRRSKRTKGDERTGEREAETTKVFVIVLMHLQDTTPNSQSKDTVVRKLKIDTLFDIIVRSNLEI
ncbi:hypothetical protein L596_015841 [Steinernema carpocapsae]|uniref:Uncharacterized protein n=1 Tax=Steinernema carpocapsae TaxID=34508 RepID=A0A4V6XW91_STECR|nr:hypothetical protein L596_015841 [Steinernema carpocapsae]